MKRILAATAALAIVVLGVAGLVAIADDPATAPAASNSREVCPPLDSGKIDTTGDPQTVTMTAPEGQVITEYCIKAGSTQSGAGVEFIKVDPPVNSITVPHPSGKAVSHYSFAYEPDVPDTTTTVPETTTTVPETTTTVEQTTTTVADSTTTTSPGGESTTTSSSVKPTVPSTTTTTAPPPPPPPPVVTTTAPPRVTIPATK